MAWDLSRATYDNKSFHISQITFPPHGLYMAPAGPWSGWKWWTTDNFYKKVYQYLFGDWKIETSTPDYSCPWFSVIGQTNFPRDMNLSYDGSKMYLIDNIFSKVFQYALSTPWNVCTASYNDKYFQLTHGINANKLRFSLDESKMYVFRQSVEDIIYQYTLATPGDVETAAYSGYKLDLSEGGFLCTAMCFSLDGYKLFVARSGESEPYPTSIRQYSLSTAWRVSTASVDMTLDVTDTDNNIIRGLAFKSDGGRMYVSSRILEDEWKNTIFQYSLVFIPEGTTQALTNITYNTATGNGNITDDGGGPVTIRGFCRIEGTEGDPTDTDVIVWETGSFGTGAYSRTLTGMTGATYYRVRAYFKTSAGTGYGNTVQLLTAPYRPYNVSATDGVHTNKVVITWTKPTGGATAYQVYRDDVALGWLGDVDTFDDTEADAPTITHGSITASDGSFAAHVALSNTGASANNGTTHTYKVKAKNAGGESEDSPTNTGYRGAGALTYQWYRSAGDGDAGYSVISGATSSTYSDTATPAGSIPGTPTGLTATDGDHTNKVALTWTNVSGAVGAGRYYKCYHTATGATPGYTGVNRGYRGAYTSTDTQVKRDTTELDAIGSLATSYDDTGADAPTITPGTASASDGSSFDYVSLSIAGQTSNDGTTHNYYVRTYNEVGWGNWTATNTGHRGVGSLTYQWQRSAGDSDADYSNISGATSDTHNDTTAPIPTITPGIAIASDGAYAAHIALNLSGQSADGEGRYYVCVLNADGSDEETSNSDRGYRSVGDLTYQWQRSAADSDASYSNISSATAATYNDTGAPSDGSGRYYKCVEDATGADQQISTADRGHRITWSTVTSQAVTDIGEISAIGNGTITDIDYEHCSKRGVCWNLTGSPTVADDTSEETDSFGTGAFTRLMTGLASDTTYYVKAYAYNSAGYSYGGEVDFTTITPQAATVITLTPTLVEDGIANLRLNLTNKDGLIINPVGWYCDENAAPSTEYIETGWKAGGGGADLALGIYSKYVKTLPTGHSTLYVQAWCDDDGSNRYTGSILSFDIPSESEYTDLPDIIFPEILELPEIILPEIPAIEIDLPDINYNIGLDLYLDRTYTRKDLEELRRKCINYEKNYTDFCLILNHNTLLVKNFLQSAYNNGVLGGENEMFTKIYPSQQLTPLYLEPLEPNDFKGIINRFINNNTSNSMGLNHNFDLFKEWLNDYNYTSDGYKASYITPKEEIITNNEPTVKYLTNKINRLQREVSMASREIRHNFNLMKEIIQ